MKANPIYLRIVGVAAAVLLAACTGKKEIGFGEPYNADVVPMTVSLANEMTTFGPEGWSGNVSFDANFWWDVAVSYPGTQFETDWLKLTFPEIPTFGTQPVFMEVLRNVSKSDRTVVLTFTSQDDPSFSRTVTITQKASKPFIELDPTSIAASLIGGDYPLDLSTSERWEIIVPAADQGWLSFTPASGTPGRNIAITMNADLNETGADRSTTIILRSKDDNSLQTTITVSQAGTYNATTLNVANSETFIASFPPQVGIQYYILNATKAGETTPFASVRIDSDGRTNDYTYDLTTFPYGTYVGAVTFNVASHLSPTVFKPSNDVLSNTHFASGLGTTDSPFSITAMRHFNNIRKVTASGLGAGFVYRQDVDLDFNSASGYVPIGTTAALPFKGIYDGGIYDGSTLTGRHTVNNLLVSATTNASGMFGYVQNGTVKNLNINTSKLSVTVAPQSRQGHGLLVGMLTTGGRVENCHLTDCNVDATVAITGSNSIGGMVGFSASSVAGDANNSVISRCTVTGGKIEGKQSTQGAGAIVGSNGIGNQLGTSIVEYCINNSMSVIVTATAAGDVGGIAGINMETIRYCWNKAVVSGRVFVGGICGSFERNGLANPNAKFIVEYCRNSGPITLTIANTNAVYAGGIAGRCNGTGPRVSNCYNTGNVVSLDVDSGTPTKFIILVGGIVGISGGAVVSDCYNTGEIKGSSIYTDLAGISAEINNIALTNCYNTGAITGTFRSAGGIGPTLKGTATITNCFYLAGLPAGAGGTALSAADMNMQASYTGWDFTTVPVWKIVEGTAPPTLANNPY